MASTLQHPHQRWPPVIELFVFGVACGLMLGLACAASVLFIDVALRSLARAFLALARPHARRWRAISSAFASSD